MSGPLTGAREFPVSRLGLATWAGLLALPLAGLAVLLAVPQADAHWEHHPAHFWLVVIAAALNVVLAVVTGDAARRRGDARLFLVSLAFLSGAGFLGLHALATPGVLLDAPNQGFVVATPVGLLLAAVFALASSVDLSSASSLRVVHRSRLFQLVLLCVIAAWAAASLAGLGPLERQLTPDEAESRVWTLAGPGLALYVLAAARYLRLLRRRPAPLLLAIVVAYVLLAEAMLAVALARNWHASWWEWHLLMLAAFAVVAVSARRASPRERFAALYLPGTAGSVREISVVFADLEGSTAWAEREGPEAAASVVDEYVHHIDPGGLDPEWSLIGDGIMLAFNRRGDEPDHAVRAVRAALELQRRASGLAEGRPHWPRFRVGVNTGPAHVGVVGDTYTPLGDAVNLAARLESQADVGEVVVGSATYRELPDGTGVRPLGGIGIKGKEAPVEAYVVLRLPGDELAGGERPDHDEPEDHGSPG